MAKKARVVEPEVMDPEPQDVGLIETDGQGVLSFLSRAALVTFFRGAMQREAEAKDLLGKAQITQAPTTAEEDTAIQLRIREAKQHAKATEEYWSITQVMSNLHRKLVAGRQRGCAAALQAGDILQSLHNSYVAEANRKAQIEQARLRREEEDRLRQERQEELERMEAEAMRLEAASEELSDRERKFVDYQVSCSGADQITGRKAAALAGYQDPTKMGEALSARPKIRAAITAAKQAIEVRRQAEAMAVAPIVAEAPRVQVEVARAAGVRERTTRKAEVVDASAFIHAVIAGKHGIPYRFLTIDEAELNQFARDNGRIINNWPGVRLVETTTVS